MQLHVRSSRERRTLVSSMLAGIAVLVLSACGSSSSSSSAGSSQTASNTAYTARLNYAKCMRAHGVNMSDPSRNGGPAAGGANIRSMRSNPKFQSANKACSSYLAKAFSGAANPAQRAQFQQQLVKFAQCMRSHGIDIPDPTTSSGGGFGILRQISSSERNSPRFKSAMQACSSTLPNRGSRGATTTTTG